MMKYSYSLTKPVAGQFFKPSGNDAPRKHIHLEMEKVRVVPRRPTAPACSPAYEFGTTRAVPGGAHFFCPRPWTEECSAMSSRQSWFAYPRRLHRQCTSGQTLALVGRWTE